VSSISVELSNDSGRPQDEFESLVYEIFDLIVQRTPVDTGECQDAWEIDAIDPDNFVIFNPTEYASYLEDGWSKQAPDGMVQVSIDEVLG